ncbi:CDP-glycerol:poly(glycerophosphate) glycerophosphotransferase [Methylotenera mobilis JLW8]|uniref:CDP-glycerol:poly(Glycerophosphate) glycerophosphotransferase n=2 Tax=Methylotenera mobilis TaxID=359408 RepID=C6WV72_METML|nr:CDP-glycerol:poly(glycerophosphate) glycerophosphotransferase [Methylotenera mobilis JLW8]
MDERKFDIFELGTVDDTVAQFGGKKLKEEVTYITPAIPMFGEPCLNPNVFSSHELTHPAVYSAVVKDVKIIGAAAFPIIQNKSICHQYFSTEYWETSEQATLSCYIKQDQNMIGYRNIKERNNYACSVINLVGNGSYNYAHWMTEFLPQLVLLKEAGTNLSCYKVVVDSRSYPSMLDALFLLGITEDQLIKIDAMSLNTFPEGLWVSPVANVVFQRPNAISSDALHQLAEPQHAIFHPDALIATRNTFLALVAQHDCETAPEKIFIKRFSGRQYHARAVVNEALIQKKLEAEGFVSIDPSTLSFTEQIRVFSKAKYIVSASGAALLNMIWAPVGAKIIVLMNDAKVVNYWYFSNIAFAVGHQLSYVLGKAVNTGNWNDINHADFMIDYQCVCQALNAAGLSVALANITSQEELKQLPVEEVLKHAVQLQHDSLFELATVAYKTILAKVPNHAEANHHFGVMVAQTAGAVDALPMLETAITSKPECEQFWVTYIDALVMSGAIPQVVDALVLGLNFGLAATTAEILGQDIFSQLHTTQADDDKKRLLALVMRLKHARLLNEKQSLSKIKVLFFVLQKSVWKLDTVFRAMLSDPLFDPVMLVCPCVSLQHEEMMAELEGTYQHFQKKGYPVINSYMQETDSWIELQTLAPDLIFFTNPHGITRPEYYDVAYMNYLSCYVPYDHQVSQYNNNQEQYNQCFHNAMWQIFVPHTESKDIFIHTAMTQGANVSVTGYPACEPYVDSILPSTSVWKPQDTNKARFIWAPHHTINSPELPYSNFLRYAELFQQLALQYADTVQWAFKPHPMLKSKLYEYEGWGKEKTDSYYKFWESQPNTQLENGEYQDLFIASDAMIHDSGSFLAEYLYLKKPVLYLVAAVNIKDYLNPFGVQAFDVCEHAYTKEDIICFIDTFSNVPMTKVNMFYQNQIAPYFDGVKPSLKIIADIKLSFGH